MQLLLVVAQQLAQSCVVEDQPPVLVDKAQASRAVLEELAELAFLVGELRLPLLQGGNVVEPRDALATDEADMTAPVRHLDIRDQGMDQLALLGFPDHLLVQQLATALAQRLDETSAVIEVMPEPPRVE